MNIYIKKIWNNSGNKKPPFILIQRSRTYICTRVLCMINMNRQNVISIVSVCDNHYMVMLSALIKSIELNHHSGEYIDYFIVDDGISEKNRKKLEASINAELIHLNWIKMSEIVHGEIKLPLDYSSFPLNIYIRLFIPYFIPANLRKVIYLDVDMIVCKDISELWSADLGDKVIGGVVDRSDSVSAEWLGIKNYRELGIPAETKYFNSGMLLINPEKWRALNITEKIISCIQDNIKFADFPDQYGLNVVFANQWLELDNRWNSQAMLAIEDPYLIHFTGRKPIYSSYDYNADYREEFFKYIRQTQWADFKPISEFRRLMKKLYNKFEKKNWFNKSAIS